MLRVKPSKKAIPAVFFQKRLNGATEVKADPERLTLFEDQLSKVTGGINPPGSTQSVQQGALCIDDYAG